MSPVSLLIQKMSRNREAENEMFSLTAIRGHFQTPQEQTARLMSFFFPSPDLSLSRQTAGSVVPWSWTRAWQVSMTIIGADLLVTGREISVDALHPISISLQLFSSSCRFHYPVFEKKGQSSHLIKPNVTQPLINFYNADINVGSILSNLPQFEPNVLLVCVRVCVNGVWARLACIPASCRWLLRQEQPPRPS